MTTTSTTSLQVLCCMCGVLIEPNAANTCSTCLASQSCITKGIATEVTLHQCRGCGRWHKEAGKWVACELESRELMGLCLGHVSGLKNNHNNTVRLVDAGWIWTEPHSLRLKVRLTVQREVQAGTILQQSFTVVFIVRNQQCVECQAEFRQGSWTSLVQVRQRVRHKRTFLFLEQVILKHGAHRGCLRIETFKDGMDFYFPDKGKAARFVAFLETVTPVKVKASKKLISTDVKSNIANFKYTHLAEICPLCKDDLLYLPHKLATRLGNIARLVLVKTISNVIHLIDPRSGQTATLTPEVFWRAPLRPIVTAARSRMTRYVVLGKEPVWLRPNVSQRRPTRKQKARLANVTVAREEDLGVNNSQYEERSHVGYLLKAGDVCVGYDLKDTHLADEEAETEGNLPDVVILRKLYGGAVMGESNVASKKRTWRLQRLDVTAGEEEEDTVRRRPKNQNDDDDMDEEDFLQEVEADKEMRLHMNLYKSPLRKANRSPSLETCDNPSQTDQPMEEGNDNDSEDDDDDQQIQLDELLDSLKLDAPPDDPEDPDMVGTTFYEEGERAAQDGLKYTSREEARNVQDTDSATVVVGTKQLAKDFTESL